MTQYSASLPQDQNQMRTSAVPKGQEANYEWTTPTHMTGSAIGYDPADNMFQVKSNQKKWKVDFAGSALDPAFWDVTTGTGMTTTVSGGVLTIATGTTANSTTTLLSKETFTIPVRAMVAMNMSQKIANQEVWLELVSVDATGAVDNSTNINTAAWKIAGSDSVTNDYAQYFVQAKGIALTGSGNVDTNVVHQGGWGIFEIEPFTDECWFHSRVMDSANGRTYSNVRHQNIPNPNKLYKLRIRVLNTATAPASTTNVQFQFVNVNDYAELTAEITAGRGNISTGQSMGVQVLNGPTVYANMQSNNSIGSTSATNLAATTGVWTGSTLDTGTTISYNTYRVMIAHMAGLTPGHLVYEQSSDNTNWRETHRVPIPSDGLYRTFEFPIIGRYVRARFLNGATAQTAFYVNTTYSRVSGVYDLDKTLTFVHSTSALTASQTFTGTTLDLGANHSVNRHRAQVYADQAGTLQLQQSRDGSAWRTTATQAVSANTAVVLDDLVVSRYVRVVYVNGATANTVCDIQSALVKN